MKYKVGDKVRIKTEESTLKVWNTLMNKWLGKVMTIRKATKSFYRMFEDNGEFLGDGWVWYPEMIESLVDEHKLVITTDGKNTTAKLYDGKRLLDTAVAVCSPEDEFNFKTGAEIAFKRLFKEEKKESPAYFTGKAVYVRSADFVDVTQGKIYNFIDGKYVDDVGLMCPLGYALYEEDLKTHGFLPIKD